MPVMRIMGIRSAAVDQGAEVSWVAQFSKRCMDAVSRPAGLNESAALKSGSNPERAGWVLNVDWVACGSVAKRLL